MMKHNVQGNSIALDETHILTPATADTCAYCKRCVQASIARVRNLQPHAPLKTDHDYADVPRHL